jgi:Cu+-exporting ATPase
MAGDASRDAAALSQANVSLAMATGIDNINGSTQVVLINSDISGILRFLQISKETVSIIGQNSFLAIAYNLIALPLALFGFVSPITAVIAMVASSLVIIFNSQRLSTIKF